MNLLQPISSIMTKEVTTLGPTATLMQIKHIFDRDSIHHIPIVENEQLVGIISKSDFLFFLHGFETSLYEKLRDTNRLKSYLAKDIMVKGIAKLESTETIRTALEVFKINILHALPIVDDGQLVGILTTHDIINTLAGESVSLDDYHL